MSGVEVQLTSLGVWCGPHCGTNDLGTAHCAGCHLIRRYYNDPGFMSEGAGPPEFNPSCWEAAAVR